MKKFKEPASILALIVVSTLMAFALIKFINRDLSAVFTNEPLVCENLRKAPKGMTFDVCYGWHGTTCAAEVDSYSSDQFCVIFTRNGETETKCQDVEVSLRNLEDSKRCNCGSWKDKEGFE